MDLPDPDAPPSARTRSASHSSNPPQVPLLPEPQPEQQQPPPQPVNPAPHSQPDSKRPTRTNRRPPQPIYLPQPSPPPPKSSHKPRPKRPRAPPPPGSPPQPQRNAHQQQRPPPPPPASRPSTRFNSTPTTAPGGATHVDGDVIVQILQGHFSSLDDITEKKVLGSKEAPTNPQSATSTPQQPPKSIIEVPEFELVELPPWKPSKGKGQQKSGQVDDFANDVAEHRHRKPEHMERRARRREEEIVQHQLYKAQLALEQQEYRSINQRRNGALQSSSLSSSSSTVGGLPNMSLLFASAPRLFPGSRPTPAVFVVPVADESGAERTNNSAEIRAQVLRSHRDPIRGNYIGTPRDKSTEPDVHPMDPVSPAPPRQRSRSRSERSLSAHAVVGAAEVYPTCAPDPHHTTDKKSVGSSSKGRKEARKKSRELDASKDHEPNVHAPEMELQDQEQHASATVSTVEQPSSGTTSISRTADIEPASKRPRRSARRGSANGRLALATVRIAEELSDAVAPKPADFEESEELKEIVGEVRHERGEVGEHAMNGEEDGRMKTRARSGGGNVKRKRIM